jgi:hypothetical protein
MITMLAAGVAAMPSLAGAHRIAPHFVILTKFNFVGTSFALAAYPERMKGANEPCLILGEGRGPNPKYTYTTSGEFCGLPKVSELWSWPADGRRRTLSVFAFPQKVTRIELNLGPLGQRNVPLHLLTTTQARQAKVPRFRWGYSRVIGKECFESLTAYGARDEVLYEAHDTGATPCEPISPWL